MSYFTANMENRTDKQKGKEKPLFKHKTTLVLTVLTVVLWVTFATVRLLLPKFTHLAYMGDGWLLIAATILTSVMCLVGFIYFLNNGILLGRLCYG